MKSDRKRQERECGGRWQWGRRGGAGLKHPSAPVSAWCWSLPGRVELRGRQRG